MNTIFAFTVTRANTPERAKLLLNTITEARKTAGVQFKWMIVLQSGTLAGEVAMTAKASGLIDMVVFCDANVGQHVAWNMAIAQARREGAKYFLRLDDDVEFPSKRWLKKLVDVSVSMDDKFILSPLIKGLSNNVPRSEPTIVKDYELEFLMEAIGGICRFHPLALLDHPEHPFVADVRKPLGGGDATSMGAWCLEHIIPMAYVRHIRVKHAQTTEGQMRNDPEHFADHDLCFHIPYIPAWRRPVA